MPGPADGPPSHQLSPQPAHGHTNASGSSRGGQRDVTDRGPSDVTEGDRYHVWGERGGPNCGGSPDAPAHPGPFARSLAPCPPPRRKGRARARARARTLPATRPSRTMPSLKSVMASAFQERGKGREKAGRRRCCHAPPPRAHPKEGGGGAAHTTANPSRRHPISARAARRVIHPSPGLGVFASRRGGRG